MSRSTVGVEGEDPSVELGLAVARVVLAVAVLSAAGEGAAGRGAGLALAILVLYVLVAAGLFVRAWRRRDATPTLPRAVHAADMLWAVAVVLAAPWGLSVVCLVFVALAATHRWGLGGAVATAGTVFALGLAFAVALAGENAERPSPRVLAVDGAALLAMVALAGHLIGSARHERDRSAFLAGALSRVHGESGFERALGTALEAALELSGSAGAVLVTHDAPARRTYLFSADSGTPGASSRVRPIEIDLSHTGVYLFGSSADAWYAAVRQGGGLDTLTLEPPGRAAGGTPPVLRADLDALRRVHDFRSLIAVAPALASEWTARLYLLDPARAWDQAGRLRFVRDAIGQLTTAVLSKYTLGRLRSHIGDVERARVARELHDGTIQSMVAVEMEIDVLRRRATRRSSPLARELERIQGLLRGQVLELRELMQRFKPLEVAPAQLVGFLDDAVARFKRETGIAARFECQLADVDLPPHVCRELVRIAQEALANVRRHSGARNVLVRLGRSSKGWKLEIDDDGRGFAFRGRLSQAELDSARKGPMVIKERVRALGGDLTVDSAPGRGARLEILWPQAQA